MMQHYVQDRELLLFWRRGFSGIAYTDGEEAERRIHDAVCHAEDRGTFSLELAQAITDWSSEYHFSRRRHCLVRPLGIQPGDKVLELGCGCGAITRFLGELGADVTAVEGSPQRARIASERCRDLRNVKVVVDDLLHFQSEDRFDWVLLVGVLEYAPLFSDSADPTNHFLSTAAHFLRPEATLVVAIENKLGLKYFNGCSEDHVNVPFYGIQGLYGPRTPRTFGRSELKAHLKAIGLSNIEFRYPFPDYKLPTVIISHRALSDPLFDPADLLVSCHARDYTGSPFRLFDDALVFAQAASNGLLPDLSNSFLVAASAQPVARKTDADLAVTYAVDRVPEFTTQTRFARIGERIEVLKEALQPGLSRRRTFKNGLVLENSPGRCDYVRGRLVLWRLLKARAESEGLQQLVDALDPWFEFTLQHTAHRSQVSNQRKKCRNDLSDYLLPGSYLDLTPYNLMETGGTPVPIDMEWKLDGLVPLGWVIMRSIVYSLAIGVPFQKPSRDVTDVIRALCSARAMEVSDNDIEDWSEWETQLHATVTGQQPPQKPVSIIPWSGLLSLRGALAERDLQIASLADSNTASKAQLERLEKLRAELTHSKSECDQLRSDLLQQCAESAHLRAELSRLSAVHNETLATISWRITEPLRRFRKRFPAAAQFGRATLQIAWRGGLLRLVHRPRLPPSNILDRETARPNLKPLDIGALELPASPSTPLVSIIIPVYNQLDFTLRCLKSIQDNPSKASAEVIVLDDASTDETSKVVAQIPGVRYVPNEHNLGFLRSCNRAALEARGEYLVFLNNDTEVQKDWLDHMLATFERSGPVGLVGAKLIYPDGRLQEAGGMIWRDASGLNFGRNDDPGKPEYNYVREADYCSGACIIIRASLFNQLGGFDELFAPAYYEDTDLAFKVRDSGYKVVYQPAAQIIHFEGGTCGTDLESGIKSYQRVNAKKFAEKWAKTLAQHYSPDKPNLLLSRDRSAVARCLLVDVWPRPDHDSGSIDLINLVKLLQSLSYKVSFFPFNTTRHFGQYTEDLQQMGVECLYEPFVTNLAKYLEVNGRHLDLVILRRAPCAISQFDTVRSNCPNAKIIFDTVDLHFLREQRAALLKNSSLEKAEELKRCELDIIKKADCALVVSEAEASLLANETPRARVQMFPFVREIPGRTADFGARRNIAFVGGYMHEPNVDAVKYFVSEIWPYIAKCLPDVQFLMVGSDMPRELYRLADERIKAIGYVQDLTSLLKSCRLTVAPLRFGAGIKGKIATSFAHGVPVVASPIAVEGMGCEREVHLLEAETMVQWVDCVTRAYTDEKLWRQLSDNGLTLMRDSFSTEAGLQRLQSLLARLDLPLPEATPLSREETPSLSIEPPQAGTANVQFASSVVLQPSIQKPKTDVRAIAFYLPQYHPIPENDKWWGKGFTEWTNVSRAKPLFRGHYQPHLPSELGFYDLRVQEVREAQADLAREHGLYGFCYHYYWFAGKRVLERPLAEMLVSGRPNFPFCISWANENWTRRWDGRDQEILLKQEYSAEGDVAFIHELIPVLSDHRYIRVNGKPLLLVYRTESMPNIRRTAEIWREEAVKAGIGDLYLCRVESFSAADPKEIGFDAACQFPPLMMGSPEVDPRLILSPTEASEFAGQMFDYGGMVRKALSADVHYKRFLGITPAWDNTPRRRQHGVMWLNSPPEEYERWFVQIRTDTLRLHEGDERLIFINAWNEWGEGCHLEPDQRYGRAYLQATQRAMEAKLGVRVQGTLEAMKASAD
jgi:GT2 family glycosyltransferase/SAM-dependent methyltransferase